jgi:hypothetical protein
MLEIDDRAAQCPEGRAEQESRLDARARRQQGNEWRRNHQGQREQDLQPSAVDRVPAMPRIIGSDRAANPACGSDARIGHRAERGRGRHHQHHGAGGDTRQPQRSDERARPGEIEQDQDGAGGGASGAGQHAAARQGSAGPRLSEQSCAAPEGLDDQPV